MNLTNKKNTKNIAGAARKGKNDNSRTLKLIILTETGNAYNILLFGQAIMYHRGLESCK